MRGKFGSSLETRCFHPNDLVANRDRGFVLKPGREVFPVALEAVRVAVGRTGGGGFEPEHRIPLRLVEGVDGADPGPEDVARAERVARAVRDDIDFALEHEIRLLERMVVWVCDRAGLVSDHEHRLQLRFESLVYQHLHGDAAVRERGGGHAGGDRRLVDRHPALQAVDVHVARAEEEEVAVPRVADVELHRRRVRRGVDEERVRRLRRPTRPRRRHLDPAGRSVGAPCVAGADRDRAARSLLQPDGRVFQVEDGLARQDVERRFERMDMTVHVTVAQLDERQPCVRGTGVAADQKRAREPGAVIRQRGLELHVLAANEEVHRPHTLAGSSSRPATSRPLTRSAPRT